MLRRILGTLLGVGFVAAGAIIARGAIAYGLEKGDDESIMVGALGGGVFGLIGLVIIIAAQRRRRRPDRGAGGAAIRAVRMNMHMDGGGDDFGD